MIILDGLDATGKTVIAQNLAAKLGYVIRHNIKPDNGYIDYLNKALFPNNTIFDRFHLSEMVWPVIFEDGRKPMLRWQQHMIERILLRRKCLLVIVMSDFDKINERLSKREEPKLTPEQILHRNNLYCDAACGTLLEYIIVYNNDSITEQVDYILNKYMTINPGPEELQIYRGTGFLNKLDTTMVVGFEDPNQRRIFDVDYAPLCHSKYHKNLALTLHISGKINFYQTYYRKTGNNATDAKAFINEYRLLNPKKVIAIDLKTHIELTKLNIISTLAVEDNYNHANEYAQFFK